MLYLFEAAREKRRLRREAAVAKRADEVLAT